MYNVRKILDYLNFKVKLPGGGVDGIEDDYQTSLGEVKEENGYEVIPETIKPFGEI